MTVQPTPQKKNPPFIILAGGIILGICVICAVIGAISNAFNPKPSSPASDPTSIQATAVSMAQTTVAQTAAVSVSPTSVPQSIDTLIPANTPIPAPTLEPKALLHQNIEQALGKSNRNVQRITALNFDDPEQGALFVNWAIDDNLTSDMIVFGAKEDAAKILKAIHESGLDYTYVVLSGSFPMTDKFGNVQETNVVNLTFYKATVEKINWTNFISDNIYAIADEAHVFADFQK